MINIFSKIIESHPINRLFNLGEKQVAWKKVKELRPGVKIAVENGDQLDWDEVVSIKKVGREEVYDIEVEGTHNFIGNGIVVHNTYISGNVGIGVATPSAKLSIGGTNSTISNTSGNMTLTPASNLIISQGNVGIGATSPTAKLDVAGNLNVSTYATVSASLALGTSTAAAGAGNLDMSGNLNLAGAFMPGGNAGTSGQFLTSAGPGATPTWASTVGASTVPFSGITGPSTNTTAAMTIGAGASLDYTSTGTINASSLIGGTWAAPGAIGTTTPAASNFTTIGVTTQGTGKFTTLEAINTGNALTLSGAGANIAFSGAGLAQITTATNQNLALMPGGNVGIGNAAPTAKLDVTGNLNVSTYATVSASLALGTSNAAAGAGNLDMSGHLTIAGAIKPGGNAGTSGYVLTSSGGGVNTWTPATSLPGTSLWQKTLGSLAALDITDAINTGAIATSSALVHLPGTNNQDAWFNLGTGNVGIGTMSPSAKLHVEGSDTIEFEALRLTNGAYTADELTTLSFYNSSYFNKQVGAIKTKIVNSGDSSELQFWSLTDDSTTQKVTIDGNGNVGIGDISPTAKLDVAGNLNVSTYATVSASLALGTSTAAPGAGNLDMSGNLTFAGTLKPGGDAGISGQYLISSGPGATPTWTSTTGTSIPFSGITSGTNTTAAMVVGAGGSLDYTSTGTINASSLIGGTWAAPGAIGTTTPAASNFTTIGVTTQGTGKFTTLEAINTGNALTLSGAGANIAFSGAGLAQITTATNQNLALMPGGNVGIGTTTPNSKLEINLLATDVFGIGLFGSDYSSTTQGRVAQYIVNQTGNQSVSLADGDYYYMEGIYNTLESHYRLTGLTTQAAAINRAVDNFSYLNTEILSGTYSNDSFLENTGVYNDLYTQFYVYDSDQLLQVKSVGTSNVVGSSLSYDATNTTPVNTYGTYNEVSSTPGGTYASSSVNNTYGEYIKATGTTTGTNSLYGLYIDSSSGGADDNWAIYSALDANSYFAGNVGIGVVTPTSAKLQVAGDIIADQLIDTTGSGAYYVNPAGSSSLGGNVTIASTYGVDSTTAGTLYLGDVNATTIAIGTNATAARTITLGNITGATAINFNTGTGGTTYTTTNGIFTLNTGIGNIGIGTDAAAKIITLGNITGATAVNVNTGTGGTTYTTTNGIFTLNTGTGNISLGTDAAAKIVTIGNVTGATAVNVNTGTAGTTYTTTNGIFTLNTGTGNISLGTDAVAKTLTLGNATGATALALNSGTGDITLTSTDQIKLNSSKAAGGTTTEAFSIKTTTDLAATDEVLQIGDSALDMMTIRGDGNVGIGTATPTDKLQVNGTITSLTGVVNTLNPNNTGANASLSWYNDGTKDWPRIRFGGTGEGAGNGFLIQGAGDSTKLTILNSGNVGIGTINPTSKLHVYSATDAGISLETGANANADFSITENGGASNHGAVLHLDGTNNVATLQTLLSGATTDIISIPYAGTYAGNVGIGTTAPEYKLDIAGNQRIQSTFDPENGGNNVYDFYNYGIVTGTTTLTSNRSYYAAVNRLDTNSSSTNATYTKAGFGVSNLIYNGITGNDSPMDTLYASYNYADNRSYTAPVGTMYGSYNYAINRSTNATSGDVTSLYGSYNRAYNYGDSTTNVSDVTNLVGVYSNVAHANTSTTGTASIGTLFKGEFTDAGDKIATKYGVYVSGEDSNYFSNTVVAAQFTDTTGSGAYYMNPAGTSVLGGNIEMRSATPSILGYDSSTTTYYTLHLKGQDNTTTASVSIDGSGSGDGKLDVGTVDPPYTIDGKKYATYLTSMTGVKEETTGVAHLTQKNEQLQAYTYTINFNTQDEASDLWLFSKTTNLKQNIKDMTVLLSSSSNGKTWYTVDKEKQVLTFFSSTPADISYRLTAPRFDASSWANRRDDNDSNIGFVINSDGTLNSGNTNQVAYNAPTLTKSVNNVFSLIGDFVDEFMSVNKALIANLKTGVIETEDIIINNALTARETITSSLTASVAHIETLIVSNKIKTPIVETVDIKASGSSELSSISTNEIKPLEKDIQIDLSKNSSPSGSLARLVINGLNNAPVATFDSAGNATLSGTLVADQVIASSSAFGSSAIAELSTNNASVSGTLIAKEIQADNINSSMQQFSSSINDVQQQLAALKTAPLADVQYYQKLDDSVVGNITITDTANIYKASISDSLMVGSLLFEQNSLLALSSDLKISSLSTIHLFDDAVIIAKNGTMSVKGEISASSLAIKNTVGETVASIDASGSARFNEVIAKKFTLDKIATNSALIADSGIKNEQNEAIPAIKTDMEVAGTGIIPQDTKEVLIYNDNVTSNSLIYLTPTAENIESQLSVAKKSSCPAGTVDAACTPYFVISSNSTIHSEIPFNWLIIN